MTIERRSAPIMILSLARSSSSIVTVRRVARAANNAASFTRFARSAPEKPGVPRAMMFGFTSSASGSLRMCTLRICSRPRTSGSGTTTWRSKRPGRSSAGSRTSGRLVAAMTITPSLPSKPSISTSSWLSVCSRSSWPPPRPAPRWRPTPSISLMTHAHAAGADTHEHLDEVGAGNREEGHLRLARDGAREQCLAGAGAADHQHALRNLAAQLLELGGVLQEVDDLRDFLLGLVHARDIGEGDADLALRQ